MNHTDGSTGDALQGVEPRMQPKKNIDVAVAFGADNARSFFPPESMRSTAPSKRALDLFRDWFFDGLKSLAVQTYEGVDETEAIRHISALMRSYQPKHEDKEWAVATLIDLWFSSFEWEVRKPQ